jgi:hypothetical protein
MDGPMDGERRQYDHGCGITTTMPEFELRTINILSRLPNILVFLVLTLLLYLLVAVDERTLSFISDMNTTNMSSVLPMQTNVNNTPLPARLISP